MNFIRNLIDKTWEKWLALLGALCVLLPVSPLNMQLTYRDSGVFLYTGWRILNGELPYRDIWDHKPPVIFYLNALGLALTDDSRWGVWLLELGMLFAAAYIGFQLVKNAFGLIPSVFSLLLWLLSLVYVLQGGNLTTEYTLPLQFAALWMLQYADQSRRPDLIFFLIGLTGAIAFFTKQTAVGIWIAIVVYLTFQRLGSKQGRQWAREISFMALGGLTFSALVIFFFGIQGAWPQFWNAAFEYNFVYAARSSGDLAARLDAILRGIRLLTRAWLFQAALVGYVIALALVLFRRSTLGEALPLVLVGLIDLPLEIGLIALPGRTFAHYYMTLLPVLAVFTGLAFWAAGRLVPDWKIPNVVKYAFALALAGLIAWRSFDGYLTQVYMYRSFTRYEPVVRYIQENTTPGDQVLVWGAETSVNYHAQRKSPARFVYQSPLYQESYVKEAFVEQFFDEVLQNKPRLIVDTDTRNPLYSFPLTTATTGERTAYLESHYCLVRTIDSWKIYEYAEDGCDE